MAQYNGDYPHGDDYDSPKFGIIVIAIVGLLYLLPGIFTTIALSIVVGTITLLAANDIIKALNRR